MNTHRPSSTSNAGPPLASNRFQHGKQQNRRLSSSKTQPPQPRRRRQRSRRVKADDAKQQVDSSSFFSNPVVLPHSSIGRSSSSSAKHVVINDKKYQFLSLKKDGRSRPGDDNEESRCQKGKNSLGSKLGTSPSRGGTFAVVGSGKQSLVVKKTRPEETASLPLSVLAKQSMWLKVPPSTPSNTNNKAPAAESTTSKLMKPAVWQDPGVPPFIFTTAVDKGCSTSPLSCVSTSKDPHHLEDESRLLVKDDDLPNSVVVVLRHLVINDDDDDDDDDGCSSLLTDSIHGKQQEEEQHENHDNEKEKTDAVYDFAPRDYSPVTVGNEDCF